MAKMFYSLEETAQKLGITPEQVKQLVVEGKLQQFRDRTNLMFKRDQVDQLAQEMASAGSAAGGSGGPIPLAEDTGKLELADSKAGSGQASGINVFDADEIEVADPMAQTQVTKAAGDDLGLDSGGSGSGLLELTRESDDTSLGAELLEEIYPGAKPEAAKAAEEAPVAETTAPVGLEGLETVAPGAAVAMVAAEAPDPAGSGLSLGFLIGAAVALILLMVVAVSALANVPSSLASLMGASLSSLLLYTGGLLIISILLGLIGYFVGRSRA